MSSFDDELYSKFSASIERWIIRMIIVLMILLVITQGLLQIPVVRKQLTSIDQREGIPYHPQQQWIELSK